MFERLVDGCRARRTVASPLDPRRRSPGAARPPGAPRARGTRMPSSSWSTGRPRSNRSPPSMQPSLRASGGRWLPGPGAARWRTCRRDRDAPGRRSAGPSPGQPRARSTADVGARAWPDRRPWRRRVARVPGRSDADGWLDTGDVGAIDADGRIWLLGRAANAFAGRRHPPADDRGAGRGARGRRAPPPSSRCRVAADLLRALAVEPSKPAVGGHRPRTRRGPGRAARAGTSIASWSSGDFRGTG